MSRAITTGWRVRRHISKTECYTLALALWPIDEVVICCYSAKIKILEQRNINEKKINSNLKLSLISEIKNHRTTKNKSN